MAKNKPGAGQGKDEDFMGLLPGKNEWRGADE